MNKKQKKERDIQVAIGALDYNNNLTTVPSVGGIQLMVWADEEYAVSTAYTYDSVLTPPGERGILDISQEMIEKVNAGTLQPGPAADDWFGSEMAKLNLPGHYETAIVHRNGDPFDSSDAIFVAEKYGDDKQAAINGHKWYVDLMIFNRPDKIDKKTLKIERCKPKERE